MGFYQQIRVAVANRMGLQVSTILTGWVAMGKRLEGMPVRRAANSGTGLGTSPCPGEIMDAIRSEIRRYLAKAGKN